jgi:hypothetical protein
VLTEDLDLPELLHSALVDSNSRVRRDACIAVGRSKGAFPDLLRVVLIRAADHAADVAHVALLLVGNRIKDVAELSLAGSALAVARTQALHVEPAVQSAAADVIACLRDLPPATLTAAEHRQYDAVAKRLAADVARSVRRKLLGNGKVAATNTHAE